MTTKKRTRSDSTAAVIRAMDNAAKNTIEPPEYAGLMPNARPFWDSNIKSKSLDLWTETDLIECADLCNNQARIIELRKELAKENKKTGEERCPKEIKRIDSQITDLGRLVAAQKRNLQIHSHATNGESRDQIKLNKNEQKARQYLDDDKQGLLAMPVH